MRLVALFFLFLAVVYWLSGSAVIYWLYPVLQRTYWAMLVGGFGDFMAGLIAGLALAVVARPRYRYQHSYAHRSHH